MFQTVKTTNYAGWPSHMSHGQATYSNFRRTSSPVFTKLSNSRTSDEPVIQTRRLNNCGGISYCALSLMSFAVEG